MKKRGSSHIEIVLSFAIFVVFIILLLALFNPFSKQSLSKNTIDVFEDEMMRELNVKVFVTGVMVKKDITKECFKFNTKQKLDKVTVKKESDGNFMEVKSESGNMINVKSNDKGFYYLFASGVFSVNDLGDPGDCQQLNENAGDYVLSNVREQDVVSEKEVVELISELSDDNKYVDAKKRLGIPEKNDIAFRVWLSDKSYNEPFQQMNDNNPSDLTKNPILKFDKYEKTRLSKREVLSRNIPIQIVNSTAGFKYAIMNIQVW